MITNAKLFPAVLPFTPQLPCASLMPAFEGAKSLPVFWQTDSEEFLHDNTSIRVRQWPERNSIYVVDDDDDVVELYTSLLGNCGHSVKAFRDRTEALAALEKDRRSPGLLIMDYLGHPMPADWFMRQSRAAHPTLRILMASGLHPADVRFSDARPDRFLQKPFSPEEFLEEVTTVLAA